MALDPINDPLDYFLERDRKKRVPDMMSRVETFDLGERPLVVPSTVRPPEYFLDEQAAVQERPVIDLTGPREIRQNDPAIGTEVMARVVPDLTQPREESDRIYSQNFRQAMKLTFCPDMPRFIRCHRKIALTQPRDDQASPDLAYTDPIEAQRARIRSLQTNHRLSGQRKDGSGVSFYPQRSSDRDGRCVESERGDRRPDTEVTGVGRRRCCGRIFGRI